MVRHPARLGLLLLLGSTSGAALAADVPAPGAAQTSAAGYPDTAFQPGNLMAAGRVAAAFGTITSGHRSAAHNRAVGGVANSYHLLGRAIDIARRTGVSHWTVDAALRRAGFRIIESLDEGDHSHFAFGDITSGPSRQMLPAEAAPVSVASASKAPSNGKSPTRRVIADEHGTLLIDGVSATGALAGREKPASNGGITGRSR